MKLLSALALALALLLTACATTSTAPAQYYRAIGQSAQVAISGRLSQTVGLTSATNTVDVMIDGKRVAGGTFSGGSAEFPGRSAVPQS